MQPNFANEFELSFQPNDMMILLGEDRNQHIATHIVMYAIRIGNGLTQIFGAIQLELQVRLQHFFDIFADMQFAKILQVGDPFKK